jgi:hypothetical protein
MPITQDRVLSLLDIIDELREKQRLITNTISKEMSTSLDTFYKKDGNSNSLAQDLLASLQAIESLVSGPTLTQESIIILTRESEHFRLRKRSNERAAKSMQRKRNNNA